MSEAALALVESEEKPSALMLRAKDVASVCAEIVKRTAMEIRGRKYVKVEGWASLAAAYGCVPSIREVVEEERGVKAVAELKRSDGAVVAVAEGFCGLDEPEWANRAMYARRGMAQTRAISRVCRTAFAFVVTLIDSDLQTTPAEEIPHSDASTAVVQAAPIRAVSKSDAAEPVRSQATTCKFGRARGKFLCDLEDSDLQWQLAAARKSVESNDPKWGASNQKWLDTVAAEVSRRGL